MKHPLIFFILSLFSFVANCQKITYSQPDPQDIPNMNLDIIGKVSGYFLVFKNTETNLAISVYDNNMQIHHKTSLDFIPNRILSIDFITYPDFAYIVYHFQKNNIIHFGAAAINGQGEIIRPPFDIYTTPSDSSFPNNNKYGLIISDDKSKIMIYKVERNSDTLNFTTVLFNDKLELIHKSIIKTPDEENGDTFTNFLLDNAGNFVFTNGAAHNFWNHNYSNTFYLMNRVRDLTLVTKGPLQDNLSFHHINVSVNFMKEIKLTVDNKNGRYLLNSLFYSRKDYNIGGLYTATWDKKGDSLTEQNFNQFSGLLKRLARRNDGYRKAFNDYFINDVILKKDGGFVLIAEQRRTESFGGRILYPHNYIYYDTHGIGAAFNRWYYGNIALLSLDYSGNLMWSNIIPKSQFYYNNDNYLSYSAMVDDEKIDFLFNDVKKQNLLFDYRSISSDGNLTRNFAPGSIGREYELMPRCAKQVSSYQVIIPCIYKNYICFAKLEY